MTADIALNEVWRLGAIVALFILFVYATWQYHAHREELRYYRLDKQVGAYGIVLCAVMIGLVANWLSPYPPTPGAKIVAVTAWVAVLVIAGLTIHNRRR